MLDFTRTRVLESNEFPAITPALGGLIAAEGRGLVMDYSAGQPFVKEATGDENEKFIGVSIGQQMVPQILPFIEEYVANSAAPYTSTFAVAQGLAAYANGVALDVVSGAAPAAGEIRVEGDTIIENGKVTVITKLTTNAAEDGQTIKIVYQYAPSILQWKTLQGDVPPGGDAPTTLGTMGVIIKGLVATTEFDTNADWSVANPVLGIAANGLFTEGSGSTITPIPNAVIIQTPSAGTATSGAAVLVFEI